MQSRLHSAVESGTNVVIGFVISYLVWVIVVVPLYHLEVSHADNFTITCIFTVTSLVRGYVVRRFFNSKAKALVGG